MKFTPMENQVSVLIAPYTPPGKLIGLARYMEELNIPEVWAAEDYFELSGFASASIILGATRNLHCGIGIVSAVARHPAVTAMDIATIANAFPGRLTVGIGHGVPFWVKQMGLYPKSPLKVLREVVTNIRALLKGEVLTQREGHFFFDNVKLTHICPDMDIVTGVVGEKSLQLSGEIADGTLASVMASPEYVRYANEQISIGAEKTGRTKHIFPVLATFAVDPDPEVAHNAARNIIAPYILAAGKTPLTGCLGYDDKVAELQALGDPQKIALAMPKEWVHKLAVTGTPEDCVAKIRALLDAGASQVALSLALADRMEEQLQVLSRDILPHFT